jgi:glycosyltransferase involved in cell wall biosynthesis
MPETKPRVLILAEAANPEWASVPLIGWSLSTAIARHTRAHVVTQVRNRAALERVGLRHGADFTALDSEAIARPLWRLGKLLGARDGRSWTTSLALSAIAHYEFERQIWHVFGAAIRAGEFDIVHRVTPLSPTVPSLLARRCARAGTPFVVGPLNGGVPWPAQFLATLRAEREWLHYVRGAYRLLPGARGMRRAAAAILAGSSHTWREVGGGTRDGVFYLPENAVDPERFPEPRTRRAAKPLRVVFVGRLVPYKGSDMLLEAALPLVKSGAVEIDFVGDGPLRPALERAHAAAGAGERVRFHGWVEHRSVGRFLRDADALALPSIREFGGGVVLEAMAVGVTPLVVLYGGPADLVDDSVAIGIPLGSRIEIIERIRAALASCADDPTELDRRGDAARERVARAHTWDARARAILTVYAWVLGRGAMPSLLPPRGAA